MPPSHVLSSLTTADRGACDKQKQAAVRPRTRRETFLALTSTDHHIRISATAYNPSLQPWSRFAADVSSGRNTAC